MLIKKIPKFCTFLYLSTFTGEGILWPQKSTPHHSEDVAVGKPGAHQALFQFCSILNCGRCSSGQPSLSAVSCQDRAGPDPPGPVLLACKQLPRGDLLQVNTSSAASRWCSLKLLHSPGFGQLRRCQGRRAVLVAGREGGKRQVGHNEEAHRSVKWLVRERGPLKSSDEDTGWQTGLQPSSHPPGMAGASVTG